MNPPKGIHKTHFIVLILVGIIYMVFDVTNKKVFLIKKVNVTLRQAVKHLQPNQLQKDP